MVRRLEPANMIKLGVVIDSSGESSRGDRRSASRNRCGSTTCTGNANLIREEAPTTAQRAATSGEGHGENQ
jgi:hypothetical protein